MVNLLIFAYVIRCLLESRIDESRPWLSRAAFAYALGITNNWAMIGFLPLFLAALIWLKGLSFFNLRFLAGMFLWGLAGLSLYFASAHNSKLGRFSRPLLGRPSRPTSALNGACFWRSIAASALRTGWCNSSSRWCPFSLSAFAGLSYFRRYQPAGNNPRHHALSTCSTPSSSSSASGWLWIPLFSPRSKGLGPFPALLLPPGAHRRLLHRLFPLVVRRQA